MEDKLVKDRLNKQHHRVEQEIKKYDEILKRNRNMRNQYDHKRKDIYHHANNENYNNSSLVDKSMDDMTTGKDLIKINGVKLDNRNLDVRRGGRGQVHKDGGLVDLLPAANKLPTIGKLSSQAKGLLAKYNRLR